MAVERVDLAASHRVPDDQLAIPRARNDRQPLGLRRGG